MSDPSNEFETVSRPKNKALEDGLDPKLVDFVKMLARFCAKRDYNKIISAKKPEEGAEP